MCVRPDTEAATPVCSVGGRRGDLLDSNLWLGVSQTPKKRGKIDPYPTLVLLLQPSLFLSATFSKLENYRVGNYFHPWDMPIEHLKLAIFKGEPCIVEGEKDKKKFFLHKDSASLPSFLLRL